jgi:hypothetical protein
MFLYVRQKHPYQRKPLGDPLAISVRVIERFIGNRMFTSVLSLSAIQTGAFRAFVSALERKAVDITEENYAQSSLLCEKFGFDGLIPQLSIFLSSAALRDAEVPLGISTLEERWQQSDWQVAERQSQPLR